MSDRDGIDDMDPDTLAEIRRAGDAATAIYEAERLALMKRMAQTAEDIDRLKASVDGFDRLVSIWWHGSRRRPSKGYRRHVRRIKAKGKS